MTDIKNTGPYSYKDNPNSSWRDSIAFSTIYSVKTLLYPSNPYPNLLYSSFQVRPTDDEDLKPSNPTGERASLKPPGTPI